MATSVGNSNLKKPWAWLAAIAVFALALGSSTALYVVNPAVQLPLPWWAGVVAPVLVYGLVLPLGVPTMRIAGWLAGFFTLAVLHVSIVLTTAWLYAEVSFISFEQALVAALWGFPPALVLAMVGSLVMILPFFREFAPRAAALRPQPGATPPQVGTTKQPRQAPPEIVGAKDRQAWARVSAGAEHESTASAATAPAVGSLPAMAVAAPALAEPPSPAPALPVVVPEEPAVHAAPLSGVNGAAPDTVEADAPAAAGIDGLPPAKIPDFRQALSELLGERETAPVVEQAVEAPEELVAAEPSLAAAVAAEMPTVSEAPPVSEAPGVSGPVIRIPFDRVVGQLPPGAFRVPLAQIGARLREAERLVVPQDLVVPQLGEGVVQVAWEVVAEQFPAAAFAVAPEEVKERIVNGRLLLPLDEIVRQLPPEVFAASIGRGPVEVPGIEGFPAPFKPPGWEKAPGAAVSSRGEAEPLSIEVPDAAEVARDLALTAPEPNARMEEVEAVPPPAEPVLAAAFLHEDARRVEPEEAPQTVLEIEDVADVLDLNSLVESTKLRLTSEDTREPDSVVEQAVEAPEELVAAVAAEMPTVSEAPPVSEAPAVLGPVIRIPFDRVVGQLPPGAFRVPLAQIGARLREAERLVVPQDLVVPQLGEGVVQVAWEVVAEQFPAAAFAVAPEEVKERIVNGRLLLPLDEIVRQLPPEVFAASIGRGPVEVPGLEGFPAPFKPLGSEAPCAPTVAEPTRALFSLPPAVPEMEVMPEPVLEPVHESLGAEPASAAPLVAARVQEVTEEASAEEVQPEEALAEEVQPEEVRAEEIPAAQVPAKEVLTHVPAEITETRPVLVPETERLERGGSASKLAALMAPWETAAFDEVQVGDFAIISVSPAGLAGSALVAAAGRLSPLIARRAPRPVEQATLRGVGGTLVLTPVGSGWNSGTALAVGLRAGSPVARLEMLARRAAVAHEPPSPAERRQTVPQNVSQAVPMTVTFDAAPLPPGAAAAVEDLQAFGPLTAQSYREPASGAVIHCFVPPGASAAELAPFAWELAQAMAQGSREGLPGSFHSAVLRSGRERLEIRRLPSAAGPAPVLVVGAADTGRPGLARLQVERAAARLGAA